MPTLLDQCLDVRLTWVQVQALLCPNLKIVTLGQSFNLTEPWCLVCKLRVQIPFSLWFIYFFLVSENCSFKIQLYSDVFIKLLLAFFLVNYFCFPSCSVVSFLMTPRIRRLISFFSVRNFKFLDD